MTSGVRRRAGRAGLLLVAAALSVLAQDAGVQIRAEIERLQRSLKEQPLSNAEMNSSITGDLKSASDALGAGRLYLALETLSRAEGVLAGFRFMTERTAEIEKGGMPAFQALWEKENLALKAFDRDWQTTNWSHARAAIRALSESARTRTLPLLEGGLGFATATGPKDGLFYLGQAEGEAGFARLCASLTLPRKGAPLPLRAMLPELQRLQVKTNAAFQPPRSIALHSRFIALNSTIKLAQELDAAKLYAGALYEYLEASRHFGMLEAAPLDSAGQAAVKQDLAAARQKLEAGPDDGSIPQVFLERAEVQIAHPDGSAPSADEWRSARVIIDQVLPAYAAARKPASPLLETSQKTIDITLVRWPYT